jgi:hypothetical protein
MVVGDGAKVAGLVWSGVQTDEVQKLVWDGSC